MDVGFYRTGRAVGVGRKPGQIDQRALHCHRILRLPDRPSPLRCNALSSDPPAPAQLRVANSAHSISSPLPFSAVRVRTPATPLSLPHTPTTERLPAFPRLLPPTQTSPPLAAMMLDVISGFRDNA